jgi:hypothetical protein
VIAAQVQIAHIGTNKTVRRPTLIRAKELTTPF